MWNKRGNQRKLDVYFAAWPDKQNSHESNNIKHMLQAKEANY